MRPDGQGGAASRPPPPADVGREMAFRTLEALESGATWARALRHGMIASVPPRERRFAHELVTGCVRLRARLDWLLAQCSSRPIDTLDPAVRVLLRLGLYQTRAESRVAEHAAVHATVEVAKRHAPQAAAFVNAVLRSALRRHTTLTFPDPVREPAAYIAAYHSHPAWLVERWLARFGFDATASLCAAGNRRPELCLRANRRRTSAAQLSERLPGSRVGTWSKDAVRCGTAAYRAVRHCVEAGLASVQDESAMLVAPLLEPQEHARLLDLAAAPGGKTCHLAELQAGTGRVEAFDRSAVKLERVRDNAARLGLDNVATFCADARTLPDAAADGVLLDAPCSGLGVLARRPDLRWRKGPDDLPRLQHLQLELLDAATRMVRPGGLLVYSVCSFEPEETTDVAARFVNAHPEYEPADAVLPEALRAGPGLLYSLPHRHGMDGGFVARWRRRG